MPTRNQRRQSITKKLDEYEQKPAMFVAVTGDTDGTVLVPGKPGWIYVTEWPGIEHEALNNVAPTDSAGLLVLVGYDGYDHTRLHVLGMLNQYSDQPANQDLPAHHQTHEWDASDTVWVQSQQIVPALVRATTGMTVTVYPFELPMADGTSKLITQQDLVLTSHVPSTGARWLVICFSQLDGSVVYVDGPTAISLSALAHTNIPAAADDSIPRAAVMLYAGETAITETKARDEILVMRSWVPTTVPTSHSTEALQGNAIDPTLSPSDGHILAWNDAAGQYEDVELPSGTVVPSDADPLPGGVADPGVSSEVSRADHVHPATSGRTLISEETPTGTGIVSWSSLSGAHKKIVIEFAIRSTQASDYVSLGMQFNGDTSAAHYDVVDMYNYAGGTLGGYGTISFTPMCQLIDAGNCPANEFSIGTIEIIEYANSGFYKRATSRHTQKRDSSSVYLVQVLGALAWRNTAAITQIDLVLDAGNFASGSVLRAYYED